MADADADGNKRYDTISERGHLALLAAACWSYDGCHARQPNTPMSPSSRSVFPTRQRKHTAASEYATLAAAMTAA